MGGSATALAEWALGVLGLAALALAVETRRRERAIEPGRFTPDLRAALRASGFKPLDSECWTRDRLRRPTLYASIFDFEDPSHLSVWFEMEHSAAKDFQVVRARAWRVGELNPASDPPWLLPEDLLPGWRAACYRETVDGPNLFAVAPQADDLTMVQRLFAEPARALVAEPSARLELSVKDGRMKMQLSVPEGPEMARLCPVLVALADALMAKTFGAR